MARRSAAWYRQRAGRNYGWRCHWCDVPLLDGMADAWLLDNGTPPGFDIATLEHLEPLSKGGRNSIGNHRLACATCNVGRHQWKLLGRRSAERLREAARS